MWTGLPCDDDFISFAEERAPLFGNGSYAPKAVVSALVGASRTRSFMPMRWERAPHLAA
jgi:hypothetical protein